MERNATVSRERVLGDTEVPRFWEAFSAAGVSGAALQVLLLTGQRPGEVTRMRYDQITDSRSASHSRAAAAWHFGQCLLRQEL